MCGLNPCPAMLCTWGEEWRRLTEARTVMKWPKMDRETYYRLVLQKRGRPAVSQLIEDIRLIWPAFGTELHDPTE